VHNADATVVPMPPGSASRLSYPRSTRLRSGLTGPRAFSAQNGARDAWPLTAPGTSDGTARGGAVHREPVVCPDCDVELDPLSAADEAQRWQLLDCIGADTLPRPPLPPGHAVVGRDGVRAATQRLPTPSQSRCSAGKSKRESWI
jgi:hypothetical protein